MSLFLNGDGDEPLNPDDQPIDWPIDPYPTPMFCGDDDEPDYPTEEPEPYPTEVND
jgi:hypothetical protein